MRVVVEHVLRGIVIAALAAMLWQSLQEPTDSGGEIVSARGIGDALPEWSAVAKPPGGIHIQLNSMPAPLERAWLGALAGGGSRVTWSGDLPAVMIDAQPIASPQGGTKVLVAAEPGSSVVIGDEAGAIDTAQAQGAGSVIALASATGSLTARVDGSVASTAQRDSAALHKVLVIGSAGWESKFVVAALEEEGWKVDAFIRVAPALDVTQGSAASIDTSRYSAVIALDGAALPYANRIIEFARGGGGVVLTPRAASLEALASIRVGSVGRAASTRTIQAEGTASLATLALATITTVRTDAVALESRGGAVAIAARRVGAGRVLLIGYDDTWRWRMGGADGAVREHRAWWTALVSSVASVRRIPRAIAAPSTDGAPMVGLVAAIGPGTPAGATTKMSSEPSDWAAWLFVLLTLAFFGEVASRRLRGAS